jgi:hypothetical protein
MNLTSHDAQLQQAAFRHVNRLADLRGGILDSGDLAGGVEFGGERIHHQPATRHLQASVNDMSTACRFSVGRRWPPSGIPILLIQA